MSSSNALVHELLQLAGIGRWRRLGGPPAFVLLWCVLASAFLGLFLWAGLSLTRGVLAAIPQVRERPERALADEQPGPGVFHGKLAGPAGQSPLGTEAVGWYGWLDREVKSGKNTRRERLCDVSRLDRISLAQGERSVGIELDRERMLVVSPGGVSEPRNGALTMIVQVQEGVPPASVLERPACKAPSDATLLYSEIALRPGSDAVVSGCRSGDRIEPCGDRADFLVTHCEAAGGQCSDARRGVQALTDHWSQALRFFGAFIFVIVGAFIAAIGGLNLSRHRKLQARRRAMARVS